MHDVSRLECLPLAALDRRPANLVRGASLTVENFAADNDGGVTGLYNNQVRLFLMLTLR